MAKDKLDIWAAIVIAAFDASKNVCLKVFEV